MSENEICVVPGYEWCSVDRQGNCYSTRTGKKYSTVARTTGYIDIHSSVSGANVRILAHRAVAITFIPNPLNKPCVNHIDGDKLNNSVSNLEWCTYRENTAHAFDNNLIKVVYGENTSGSKYEPWQVHSICKMLEYGYSVKSIEDLLCVPQYVVRYINRRHNWESISQFYNFPNREINTRNKPLDDATVINICKCLEKYTSVKEISEKLNVSILTIYNIKYRRNFKRVSKDYNF